MRRIVIVVKRAPESRRKGKGWVWGTPKEHRSGEYVPFFRLKRDAVRTAKRYCLLCESTGKWAQLRVYGPRGLQYEHTYPRKSDPKHSKG